MTSKAASDRSLTIPLHTDQANYQQGLERYIEFGDDYWGNIAREAIDRLSD